MNIGDKPIEYQRGLLSQPVPGRTIKTIYMGEVVSIDDPTDGMRIRIRIREDDLDNKVPNENLPLCDPFLDKQLFSLPRVGEGVRVILGNAANPQQERYYVGRLIPQLSDVAGMAYLQSTAGLDRGFTRSKTAVSRYPEADGVFPGKGDVALMGRDNAQVVLRPKSAEIGAGGHEVSSNRKRNTRNPAVVKSAIEADGKRSYNLLMADENFIVSHQGARSFPANPTPELIEQLREKAHSLPYGEPIVEVLQLFLRAFLAHVHPYSNRTPVSDVPEIEKLVGFDMGTILSPNKIN